MVLVALQRPAGLASVLPAVAILAFGGCDTSGPGEGRKVVPKVASARASEAPAAKPSPSVYPAIPGAPGTTNEAIADDGAVHSEIEALLAANDLEGAAERLRAALIAQPDSVDLLIRSARLDYQSGRFEQAIDALRTVSNKFPENRAALGHLAEALNGRGFRFDGNEQLRSLPADAVLSPQELAAIAFPMRTFVTLASKPNIQDSQEVERYGVLNVVAALRQRGVVGEALECLNNSELLARADPDAVAQLGWLLALSQRYDDLAVWARDAEPGVDRFPAYWLALAALARHRDDHSAVPSLLAEALDREASIDEAIDGMIEAATRLGRDQLRETFQTRKAQHDEIEYLINELAYADAIDPAMVKRLSALLNACGRIYESLCWQQAMVAALDPGSPQLAKLVDFKRRWRERHPRGFDTKIVRAGIRRPDEATLTALREKTSLGDADVATRATDSPQGIQRSWNSFAPSRAAVFVNEAPRRGLSFRYDNASVRREKEFRLFEALGGGVAAIDYDRDGTLDLHFAQAGCDPPDDAAGGADKLYRGLGDRFDDVASLAGVVDRRYSHGVTAGDWNQDGFADLVVGNIGLNRLWINQGDGTFRPGPGGPIWDDPTLTMSVAIADVSGDSCPDIVEINYVDDPDVFVPVHDPVTGEPVNLPAPLKFDLAIDRVFVGDGTGHWHSKSLSDGRGSSGPGTGLGVWIGDLDGDRQNELFVANDQMPNRLWVSGEDDGDIAWRDEAVNRGVAFGNGGKPMASMGIAAADFDQDGSPDLHVTNYRDEWSNLYLQRSAGLFADRSVAFGIDVASVQMLGFGTQSIDYDGNGSRDLIVGNGHIEDLRMVGETFRMPTQVLTLEDGTFADQPVDGGDPYWQSDHLARCLIRCDQDRDGRGDFVVTDLLEPAALMLNRTEQGGSTFQVELVGVDSERDAIGARISVDVGDQTYHEWVATGDGYLGKNENVAFFALPPETAIDGLRVRWPGRDPNSVEQVIPVDDLDPDSRILIVQGQSSAWTVFRLGEVGDDE